MRCARVWSRMLVVGEWLDVRLPNTLRLYMDCYSG